MNSARADSTSAVQTFSSQMGSWNVITTGAFSTDSHVHGKVAVGGAATLSGNAEINSHGTTNAEALRVYGNLNLYGMNNKVLSGSATVVKNSTVNTQLTVVTGPTGSNQTPIVDTVHGGTLVLNGNGGTPTVSTLAAADNFFISRDNLLQTANTDLLNASGALSGTLSGNRLSFNTATAGVSVFNWNIDQLTNIGEVGFNLGANSFAVVNIIGNTFNTTWNAGFNFLAGSDFLASHILWNIGIANVNLNGSEILGSILAPDTNIVSYKQLNGSIYAGSLNQHGQEIHYTRTSVNVPEESSMLVTAFAAVAIGLAAWARRFLGRSAS